MAPERRPVMARLSSSSSIFAIAFHLILISNIVSGQIILAPSKLYLGKHPNKLLTISSVDEIATLSVSLDANFKEIIHEDFIEFRKDAINEITIPGFGHQIDMAATVDEPFERRLFLNVDGLKMSKSTHEQFSTIKGLVYFQTDKPIYRTTETVRFRVLCLQPSLLPVMDVCNLTIKNHQNLKLDFVKLTLQPPYHFADYAYQLSLLAKEGIWSAELHCGNNIADKLNFEVRDYVAPIMKIDIQTPDVHLCSSRKFDVRLNVTYTYGKPVQGYVYFRIGLRRGIRFEHLLTTNTLCLDDGFLHQTFDVDFCKYVYAFPQRISIEAVVTDSQTNVKERSISNHTQLTECPYQISMEHTPSYYKIKLFNYITCQIVDLNGNPVPDVSVQINITSQTGLIDGRLYTFPNEKTDKDGLVVHAFQFHQYMGKLLAKIRIDDPKCDARTAQIMHRHEMYPFGEQDPVMITIVNRKKIYYDAGTSFQSSVARNGAVNKLFWVVASKGYVFKHGTADNMDRIEFRVENYMAPTIRVLVLGMLADTDQLVADSIRIHVKQKNCSADLEVLPNQDGTKTFVPGANITFRLRGAQYDVLALNAVDESVYLLRNKKDLARKRFRNSLLDRDLGNGPGGGKNSTDVIHKAGFKILYLKNAGVAKRSIVKREAPEDKIMKLANNPECKHLVADPCCLLVAYTKTNYCSENKKIIEKYHEQVTPNCSKIFLQCCRCLADLPRRNPGNFQFSSVNSQHHNENFPISMNSMSQSSDTVEDQAQDITRYDFRDSWLFDLILLNSKEQTYTAKIPHSITSWIVSTLSVSNEYGFCINPDQRLITYKPFFVHVSMPQYVVLREQTEIKATLFNYLNEDLHVHLSLYKTEGICSEASQSNKVTFSLKIPANSAETKAFAIVPIQAGVFTIKLEASSHKSRRDTILKNMTVVFPGVTKESSISLDLDPTNRARRETTTRNQLANSVVTNTIHPEKSYQKIDIILNDTDQHIIPGTVRHKLSFIGQRFNPTVKSIEDLQALIKKPKGCGEQNMYYMAFNLYTLIYLKQIEKLKPTMEIRGTNYLKRAFRQQLHFRKDDGSFSAFDNRESSVWLTAFVVKVFCRSNPFLKDLMDDRIVLDAVKWLQSAQMPDGSWIERYQILHEKAQGGSNQGSKTLTAYILIALNECRSFLSRAEPWSGWRRNHPTMERAESFLSGQIQSVNDSYTLSIMTYALLFPKSKFYAVKDFMERSLMKHHELQSDSINNFAYYNNIYSIETTSYVLLSLIKTNQERHILAEKISNWLLSQQTNGAFDNTQNTIVALEALTAYHIAISSQIKSYEHILYANVSFNSRHKRQIKFNNENMDLLHIMEVDRNTRDIEINTTGKGFGRMELLTIYNVHQPNDICYFDFEVDIIESKSLHYTGNEIDPESAFSRFPTKMKNELNMETSPSHTWQSNCKHSSRRQKRAFWSGILQRLKKPNPKLNDTGRSSDDSMQSDSTSQKGLDDCSTRPPPNLDLENALVRIINICLRRLIDESGMVIMDFTVLSGYEPVPEDLEKLKTNGIVEFFEIVKGKINFYFKDIPNARTLCLCFRIYQRQMVQNIQSALVQVYDYYRRGSSCTRLYTDVSIPKYINYKCRRKANDLPERPKSFVSQHEEACKCVINKKCPNNERIDEIIKLIKKESISAADKEFQCTVRTYTFVAMGRVGNQDQDTPDGKIFIFEIEEILFEKNKKESGKRRKNIKLRLNPECDTVIQDHDTGSPEMILLMVDDEMESPPVLDGQSIFYRMSNLDNKKQEQIQDLLYWYRHPDPFDHCAT